MIDVIFVIMQTLLSTLCGYGIFPRSLSSILLGYGEGDEGDERDPFTVTAAAAADANEGNDDDENGGEPPPIKRVALDKYVQKYDDTKESVMTNKHGSYVPRKLWRWLKNTFTFNWDTEELSLDEIKTLLSGLVQFCKLYVIEHADSYNEYMNAMDDLKTEIDDLLGAWIEAADENGLDEDVEGRTFSHVSKKARRRFRHVLDNLLLRNNWIPVIKNLTSVAEFVEDGILSYAKSYPEIAFYADHFGKVFDKMKSADDIKFSDDLDEREQEDDSWQDDDSEVTKEDLKFLVPDDMVIYTEEGKRQRERDKERRRRKQEQR